MSEYYWTELRSCLIEALKSQLTGDEQTVEGIISRLTLRPPKNSHWGDLCTNAAQLCQSVSSETCLLATDLILEKIRKHEAVKSVDLAESGDINITLKQEKMVQELPKVISSGVRYGLSSLKPHCTPLIVEVPDETHDLLALRQLWTANYLKKFADLIGLEATESAWTPGELQGYPAEAALAKCGESRLRLALFANDKDFATHFSPVLAVDRTYSNPVFALLYAEARLKRYLRNGVPLDAQKEGSTLPLAIERELLVLVTEWPQVIRLTLRDQDMVNFVSFLQRLSLLFFRLNDEEKLQSSEYFQDSDSGILRLQLLGAVRTLLTAGLDLMDVERPEEFI
ncbi:DALR anticodon-binding domain-containing protein [Sneathiella limimaris]|uniref:DALR anticodon-binding domain-containing protein n=1 Tax=Sneathiella limimaris TaxID=1964213 RepID=UPI00146F171D|nr:DALR anticodon-binding domain-containing protein [Sneathiella limimaris]